MSNPRVRSRRVVLVCCRHSTRSLSQESDLSYHLSEHLRMNGIYWGLVALYVLGRQDALDRDAMIAWVQACWDERVGACLLPYFSNFAVVVQFI